MPTVVLGVSASIAAYKAADLASQLVKSGVEVYPVMTADAARFVQPATFRALTHHPCPIDVFEEPFPGEIAHIWLARNCDLFAIVPASMNVIARLANGLADDMLTAAAMACTAPDPARARHEHGHVEQPGDPGQPGEAARLRLLLYRTDHRAAGLPHRRRRDDGRCADDLRRHPGDAGPRRLVARRPRPGHRRPDPRAAGPGAFPVQPLVGQDGLCAGRSRPRARGRRSRWFPARPPCLRPAAWSLSASRPPRRCATPCCPAPRPPTSSSPPPPSPTTPASSPRRRSKKATDSPPRLPLTQNDDILALLGQQKRPGQTLVGFAAETGTSRGSRAAQAETKNLTGSSPTMSRRKAQALTGTPTSSHCWSRRARRSPCRC